MAFRMGSSTSPFSFSTPQLQQQQAMMLPFQTPAPAAGPGIPPPPQQQIHLLSNDKTPVSYHTKWAEILPESQQLLLQIEERILEYRDESRRLDQCERLYDTVALNEGFELDATRISQELGGITTALEREKSSLEGLMKVAKELMRNAEVAVRSFMMLRSRFLRPALPSVTSSNTTTASLSVSGVNPPAAAGLQSTPHTVPVVDFYSGIPIKPSPFLQQTTARFEHQFQEYRQWIEELERLLLSEGEQENGNTSSELSLLQSLPTVISNIHDFFIYVAAEVESLHQQIGSMRSAYLTNQQRRGEDNNPFLEADRRESAKREAAARRVHPTLHVASLAQPSTQTAGLFTNSAHPSTLLSSASSAAQSSSSALSASSSSFNQSLFGTSSTFSLASASSAPVGTLFGTPSTPASSFSLLGSSGTSPTPSILGAGTSSSIFGASSTSSSSSGGLFGVASSGLLGSSPTPTGGLFIGGQTSGGLFGTTAQQFSAGNISSAGASLFGIGTAQGTSTVKAKSRTSRRK